MKLIKISLIVLLPLLAHSQWFQQQSGVTSGLTCVHALDSLIVYVGGSNYEQRITQIIKTSNGGINWYVNGIISTHHVPRGIYFLNQQTGFLLGGYRVYRTYNSSLNWIISYYAGAPLERIDFGDSSTGYVVGWFNTVLKTTDKGINWISLQSLQGNQMDFYCIDFINAETGYIAGRTQDPPPYYTRVYKTTNGGLNWSMITMAASLEFVGISFCNINSGYLVSRDGLIYRTTNGGSTYEDWTLVAISYYGLMDVHTINANTTYVLGDNGYIGMTTNSGNNWITQSLGSTVQLAQFSFLTKEIAYAVGVYGIILKTTNGGVIGIIPISNNVPKDYKLYQNYPNPFNPVTKIKFDIPPLFFGEEQGMRLVIYDILGREVTTLVNEHLNPGTYEVEFDGTNFVTGVYFYTLTAGDFRDTRKLVLIK